MFPIPCFAAVKQGEWNNAGNGNRTAVVFRLMQPSLSAPFSASLSALAGFICSH